MTRIVLIICTAVSILIPSSALSQLKAKSIQRTQTRATQHAAYQASKPQSTKSSAAGRQLPRQNQNVSGVATTNIRYNNRTAAADPRVDQNMVKPEKYQEPAATETPVCTPVPHTQPSKEGTTHPLPGGTFNKEAFYLFLFQKRNYQNWKSFNRIASNSSCFTDIIFSNPSNDTLDVYVNYHQATKPARTTMTSFLYQRNYNSKVITILPNESVRIHGICSGTIEYNAISHGTVMKNKRNSGLTIIPKFFDHGFIQLNLGDAHITLENEY